MNEINQAGVAHNEFDQALAALSEDELNMIAGGTPVVNAV
jgi:hypothetical protein